MAVSQKEYQMLFTLAGSINSNFGQSFQKAQSEMARLKEEAKTLGSLLGDVHNYERHQKEVENTAIKLNSLERKLQNVQDELNATGNSDVNLKNKEIDLQRQIALTSNALMDKCDKLSEEEQRLTDAGLDVKNLSSAEADLTRRIKENADAMRENKDAMDSSTEGVKDMAELITTIGIADKLSEISDAYKACVKASGDLEFAMSNVEALTGANSIEMELLTQKAKDLGAETIYTAEQIAEAMGYMGMAGWDAQEMLNGISGVINLAAASGEDLATVSDIVTDNLSAFKLTAADTARMADVLASAATNSNTNVYIMGETFKNSASIAGALGYTIEDVATAIGIMANSGVKGSMAGTALRNIFNGLINDATLTSDAFGEYTLTAVKTDGTLKTFSETISELRGLFDQMTEAERVNNAMAIAGKRSYNGLLAIINSTDEEYQKLYEDIVMSSGAAQKMADIKLDNLNGQLKILESAWDAIKVTLGDLYRNELTKLTEVGSEILHGVNEFIQNNPVLAKGLIAGVGAFAAITAAVLAYSAVVKVATVATAALGTTLGATFAWGVGIAAVVGMIAGIAASTKDLSESEAFQSASAKKSKEELTRLNNEYERSIELTGEYSEESRLLKVKLDEATAAYENVNMTSYEFFKQQEEQIKTFRDSQKAFDDEIASITGYEQSNASLSQKLSTLVDENGKVIGSSEEVKAIVDALNQSIPDLGLAYDAETDSINRTTDAIIAYAQAEADRLEQEARYQHLVEMMRTREDLKVTRDKARSEAEAAAEEWERVANKYHISDVESGIMQYYGNSTAIAEISRAINETEAANASLAAAEAAYDDCEEAISDLTNAAKEYNETQAELDAHDINGYVSAAAGALQKLSESYTEVYNAAYDSITGRYSLWDEAAKVEPMKIKEINKAMEEQAKYWNDYKANLDLIERYAEFDAFSGLSDVMGEFADGSKDSVDAVAGIAKAIKDGNTQDLKAMIENYQNLKTVQEETADSIGQVVTDYDDKIAELTSAVEDGIASLSLTEEARAAAEQTIDSYLEVFESEKTIDRVKRVVSAFREAALAGVDRSETYNPYGYASGTSSATPGWHLVGEEGPELMLFGGGERVLNTADTTRVASAITSGSNSNNNVSVAFNIGGNADAGTLASLREYGAEFAERVMEVINGANSNSLRRAYV